MRDWSAAVRRPPAHRVNLPWLSAYSWTYRNFILFFSLIMLGLIATFLLLLVALPSEKRCPCSNIDGSGPSFILGQRPYNATYPLTEPIKTVKGLLFRIAVITDLDHASKSDEEKHTWFSYLKKGYLLLSHDHKRVNITWDDKIVRIKSTLSQGGRSMELSDLKVFDGHLFSVDDRTGVLYRIENDRAIAWVVLPDGPGNESKGFKGEWLTVKDRHLYVGGLGKEWTTTTGEFQNYHPMWVKAVSASGQVFHLDWVQYYIDLRGAAGIRYPGYMIHESAQWSDVHRKWIFLPRRASKETYAEDADEKRATNHMLLADENFKNIQVQRVGPLSLTRGFSAFQFVPGTRDTLIVALKSEEIQGVINSYITVFDIYGKVILEETLLDGHFKFEGIEFV